MDGPARQGGVCPRLSFRRFLGQSRPTIFPFEEKT
jgi:hypothetical protein